MSPQEVIADATAAGLSFVVGGGKLRVLGGDPETRAKFLPLVGPLARDIAALVGASTLPSLGGSDPSAASVPKAETRRRPEAGRRGVAATPACTLGKRDPAPCPLCRIVHGELDDAPACVSCGSIVWRLSLVAEDGLARRCVDCVRKGRGTDEARTPHRTQTAKPDGGAA